MADNQRIALIGDNGRAELDHVFNVLLLRTKKDWQRQQCI